MFLDPISESTPHIYTSFLRVAIEDSIVAKHYSRYAHKGFWIEYIGEKLRNDCIKVIDTQIGDGDLVEIVSVSFSPDGNRIVCGSYSDTFYESEFKTVCILDTMNWRMIVGPLEGHISYVSSVTFSPDGRYVLL